MKFFKTEIKTIECPYCKGSGVSEEGTECPWCYGSGLFNEKIDVVVEED